MKHVITDETMISIITPRFSFIAAQPSLKLSGKDASASAGFAEIPLRTTAVHITVRKNVPISIIKSIFTSLTVSTKPAISGDIRNLALPAMLTMPLALEYSS